MFRRRSRKRALRKPRVLLVKLGHLFRVGVLPLQFAAL